MADLMELSQDRRLRNHFNIDKKRRTSRHRQSSPHFHSYYELYLMQEGGCRFFLLDTTYELKGGEFILVPPEAFHIVSYDLPGCKGLHDRYALYFDTAKISESLRPFLAPISGADGLRHFRIQADRIPEVYAQLNMLLEMYRLNNPYGEQMLDYLFPAFLLFLAHNSGPAEASAITDHSAAEIEIVTHYIARHYAQPLSLSQAADLAGFTPTYFSRKFKETVGIGFRDYQNHIRLRESARLLLSTRLSIQEISSRCGFTGSNYFGDVFRSAFGVSPRTYRQTMGDGSAFHFRTI